MGDIRSMEKPIKNHEIPERPGAEEALKPPYSDYRPDEGYPNASCSGLKSHRSEDISVREDEDGVRTHCCPLDTFRDSPTRNEGEVLSAKPSNVDIDAEIFLKTFNLKSEDITSLLAEKPPQSESDGENDSEFDVSTSMFYASHRNRQFVSADNSLKRLLDHQMASSSSEKLSENVISSWLEDSSEEEESSLVPSVTNKEMKLGQKYTALVESDMEEFERTEPKASCFEEMKYFSDSKQTNVINKIMLNNEESLNNKTVKSNHTDGKSNKTNISVIKVERSSAKEDASVLKTASENSIRKSETSKENSDSECCPQEVDDEAQINDLLKVVVEQAIWNATEKLQISHDEIPQNSGSALKEDKPAPKQESVAAERHLLKDTNTEVKKTDDVLAESNIILGKGSEKPEEIAPTYKVYINTENPVPDLSVRFKVSKVPDSERKEEMKGNYGMEPMSLHSKNSEKNEETQPDLATALRFMTEVFPNRNDPELYIDTLSTSSDNSSEKSAKARLEASTRKHRKIQEKPPFGNTEGETSTIGSGPFEPVILEDQRTVKRPRNKFSKFFQSFKRRLVKKS